MIKIGILGMSEGNAHPYSWSAIINGKFDSEEITQAGFPAVATYLQANRDTLGLPTARVTHVWCSDRAIGESISRSSGIAIVVDHLEEMIGHVDAVILARDDPENHKSMAKPFIEAGIPIFIDKPLTYSRDELEWFAMQVERGRFVMSCSSMRFATECRIAKQELGKMGEIKLVTALGKKDWKKYGIHLLEAVFALLDDPKPVSVQSIGQPSKEIVSIRLDTGTDIVLSLYEDIVGTFQLSIFGADGWKLVDIRNSYSMFRDNMIEFIRSVDEGKPRLDFRTTYSLINVLIGAKESQEAGGTRIIL